MKDFCTYSPDTIFGYYIGDCCKKHDEYYWQIDWDDEHFYLLRLIADKLFRFDLLEILPWYLSPVAWIYYFMVRIFGSRIISKLRWKYGK